MGKKFNLEQRYLTSGVSQDVPFEIQIFLWKLIEDNNDSEIEMDYLQVFKFEEESNTRLKVIHTQEQPEYKKEHSIKFDEKYRRLIGKKVFVIDDKTHSTMLFASEY